MGQVPSPEQCSKPFLVDMRSTRSGRERIAVVPLTDQWFPSPTDPLFLKFLEVRNEYAVRFWNLDTRHGHLVFRHRPNGMTDEDYFETYLGSSSSVTKHNNSAPLKSSSPAPGVEENSCGDSGTTEKQESVSCSSSSCQAVDLDKPLAANVTWEYYVGATNALMRKNAPQMQCPVNWVPIPLVFFKLDDNTSTTLEASSCAVVGYFGCRSFDEKGRIFDEGIASMFLAPKFHNESKSLAAIEIACQCFQHGCEKAGLSSSQIPWPKAFRQITHNKNLPILRLAQKIYFLTAHQYTESERKIASEGCKTVGDDLLVTVTRGEVIKKICETLGSKIVKHTKEEGVWFTRAEVEPKAPSAEMLIHLVQETIQRARETWKETNADVLRQAQLEKSKEEMAVIKAAGGSSSVGLTTTGNTTGTGAAEVVKVVKLHNATAAAAEQEKKVAPKDVDPVVNSSVSSANPPPECPFHRKEKKASARSEDNKKKKPIDSSSNEKAAAEDKSTPERVNTPPPTSTTSLATSNDGTSSPAKIGRKRQNQPYGLAVTSPTGRNVDGAASPSSLDGSLSDGGHSTPVVPPLLSHNTSFGSTNSLGRSSFDDGMNSSGGVGLGGGGSSSGGSHHSYPSSVSVVSYQHLNRLPIQIPSGTPMSANFPASNYSFSNASTSTTSNGGSGGPTNSGGGYSGSRPNSARSSMGGGSAPGTPKGCPMRSQFRYLGEGTPVYICTGSSEWEPFFWGDPLVPLIRSSWQAHDGFICYESVAKQFNLFDKSHSPTVVPTDSPFLFIEKGETVFSYDDSGHQYLATQEM